MCCVCSYLAKHPDKEVYINQDKDLKSVAGGKEGKEPQKHGTKRSRNPEENHPKQTAMHKKLKKLQNRLADKKSERSLVDLRV